MTDLEQAAAIGGGIFAVVMISQYGKHDYSFHKLLRPVISVAAVAYFYLKGAPTDSQDLVAYGIAVAIGTVFAIVATLQTRVERDTETGGFNTITGKGFVATWSLALVLRLAFIYSANHIGWFRNEVGTFMQAHQLVIDSIAPFFVTWALTMVLVRIALIAGRVAIIDNKAPIAKSIQTKPWLAA